jgi:hypothetical protein
MAWWVAADEGKKPSVTALTREAEPFTVSFAVSNQFTANPKHAHDNGKPEFNILAR